MPVTGPGFSFKIAERAMYPEKDVCVSFPTHQQCRIWSFPPNIMTNLLTSVHAATTRNQQNQNLCVIFYNPHGCLLVNEHSVELGQSYFQLTCMSVALLVNKDSNMGYN
ncbi:hypothetical protein NC652_021913 [Populus alba x Populus x berolinensis]|uniref:Uncharacterized protein n=1 Tax=Populus alba x Populus x berolinensis TaxID=444605 RepID=A0AAD6QE26_9ROSI|nr:hypothetical protein NC652_021913 [Populus alba x Populus x berolinensis]KAJ6988837.1 hypothetical protein NC653_021674 [Populus alba x Populus x berolinensis]